MVKSSKSSAMEKSQSHKTRLFKGVRMRKWGKWVSEVRMPNSRSRIWLGSYDSPQQAARAYDCAVYCLRGFRANFNFPESLPEIPVASSFSPAQIQFMAAKFARGQTVEAANECSAFSGSDCQSCIEGQQIPEEEEDWGLLDSLLRDIQSSHSPNLEHFVPAEEGLKDIRVLLLED